MKVVLLPVKGLATCKERLSPLLSRSQRGQLMWSLYRRTCRTVLRAADFGRSREGRPRNSFQVAVVTCESKIADDAAAQGWEVLLEPASISESRSVDWASGKLRARGARSVLRLPCDLPLLQAADVLALWEASLDRNCVLVPSRSGKGTNALLRIPPDAFPSCFGPGSRRLHEDAARKRGYFLRILERPRLALDIDDPDDVRLFLGTAPVGCPVAGLLRSWGMEP